MSEKIRVCNLKVNDVFQKMFSTYTVTKIEDGKIFYSVQSNGYQTKNLDDYLGCKSQEWVLLIGKKNVKRLQSERRSISVIAFDLNGNEICEGKTMLEVDAKLSLYRGYVSHWFRRKNRLNSKFKFVKKIE